MKKVFKIIGISVCLLFSVCCNAQKNPSDSLSQIITYPIFPKKQSLYVEFFGNSGNLYSLNYDRSMITHKENSGRFDRYIIRIGINYFDEKFALPFMILFNVGNEHYFEAGAGWVPLLSSYKRIDGIALFSGYRYQPDEGGIMARMGLTPTYMVQGEDHWSMIFGVSFGYSF